MRMSLQHFFVTASICLIATAALAAPANENFENLLKKSEQVESLPRLLQPFVVDCSQEKNETKRLYCRELYQRLREQRAHKMFHLEATASTQSALNARFVEKPKPQLEITVRGCLTCSEPHGEKGAAKFFLFKKPKDIRPAKGGGAKGYELTDIDLQTIKGALPAKTTEKQFREEILPHLRLDFVFQPTVEDLGVGKKGGAFSTIGFKLLGHRVYDKCSGVIYSAAPKMTVASFPVDKTDMSCVQNQPKKADDGPKLPSGLPQARVKELLDGVGADVQVCFEMYGQSGEAPTEIIVAPDGKVKSAKVSGKLQNTPAAACVERLVKDAIFPQFSGQDAKVQWPFLLRD